MRKWWEAGILLFAVAGFWGMIYPDLCFVQEVCSVECVQPDTWEADGEGYGMDCGEQEEGTAWEPDIYTRICVAEPERIRVRSRLLEWFRKEPSLESSGKDG